jgi:DNA-binding response OmpR family regulator
VKKVLVVDDDMTLHKLVGAVIQMIGDITVESCFSGREALRLAIASPPDLIISDVHMPDMDGIDLTRLVRSTPAIADTPILLLTGLADNQDKYRGFIEGADDYLVKPFDAMELQLRVKALLRRAEWTFGTATPRRLEAGPLVLDPHKYVAKIHGANIRLTASEFAILAVMVAHPDEAVAVETLLVDALDYPSQTGNPQVVHTHIKNIRGKLRTAGVSAAFLGTTRQGYTLITMGHPDQT